MYFKFYKKFQTRLLVLYKTNKIKFNIILFVFLSIINSLVLNVLFGHIDLITLILRVMVGLCFINFVFYLKIKPAKRIIFFLQRNKVLTDYVHSNCKYTKYTIYLILLLFLVSCYYMFLIYYFNFFFIHMLIYTLVTAIVILIAIEIYHIINMPDSYYLKKNKHPMTLTSSKKTFLNQIPQHKKRYLPSVKTAVSSVDWNRVARVVAGSAPKFITTLILADPMIEKQAWGLGHRSFVQKTFVDLTNRTPWGLKINSTSEFVFNTGASILVDIENPQLREWHRMHMIGDLTAGTDTTYITNESYSNYIFNEGVDKIIEEIRAVRGIESYNAEDFLHDIPKNKIDLYTPLGSLRGFWCEADSIDIPRTIEPKFLKDSLQDSLNRLQEKHMLENGDTLMIEDGDV